MRKQQIDFEVWIAIVFIGVVIGVAIQLALVG